MSKNHRNLRTQMRNKIFDAFHEGMDKHALKKAGEAEGKIFSYGSKFTLLDRCNDFARSDAVRGKASKLEHLTPKMAQDYLDKKASDGCTQATLDEYRSELKRIGRIIGVDLSTDRVLANRRQDPNRGANDIISKKDMAAILEYIDKHPSKSGVAIQLECETGIRAGDLCYGVEIKRATLHIRSKNGKYIDRPITPAIRTIINSEAFRACVSDGHYYGPKDNSLNTYLRRTQEKLGLEKHSCHAIRRRVAQDKYNEYRNTGLTRTEALKATSKWLNHGENRESMLLKSYISNAW